MNAQQVQPADAVEELERLGNEALAAGRLNEALDRYQEINNLIRPLVGPLDEATSTRIADVLNRTRATMLDVKRDLRPPEDRAVDLLAEADAAIEVGEIAHASHLSFRLGETLEELGDREGAESAYRRALVLARQVDAGDPELMLAAFRSLITFLPPSEESIALAQEMAANLLERDEMYHPMRAAEAAYHWSVVELKFAEVTPLRVDHVINGIALQAIDMLDDVCFHGWGQELQRLIAGVLHAVGREDEAGQWASDADKYEDWEAFMDQEIPGHVHLWDIRVSHSPQVEEGE